MLLDNLFFNYLSPTLNSLLVLDHQENLGHEEYPFCAYRMLPLNFKVSPAYFFITNVCQFLLITLFNTTYRGAVNVVHIFMW